MNDVKNLKIAFIGGGSRGWAKNLMNDLANEPAIAGKVCLYDIDMEAAKKNAIIGNLLTAREDTVGKWEYVVCNTSEECLTGADFVIMSILPGTFDEMESDVHAPEKYGIYQSVGDTTGPGGCVRALRAVPIFYNYAKQIEKCCPDAWVINFTNPMAMCVTALYRGFPGIKAFGCCHEVFGTQEILANVAKEKLGIEAKRDDIRVNVLGINHFTWLDKATCKGHDLMPLYGEYIKDHPEGVSPDGEHWANGAFDTLELVKFELFNRYGVIAAAGDRHLAEFMPGNWYLSSPERVAEMKFGLTPVSWRKEDLEWKIEIQDKRAAGDPFKFYNTGEESVRQMKAILGMESFVTNVNMPNRGQMENIPLGIVVETNANFGSGEVRPLCAGKLPNLVNAMVTRVALNQDVIVDAAISGDYELAFQAFANDPNMPLSLADARKLFNEMLYNTRKYLPFYEEYAKTQK